MDTGVGYTLWRNGELLGEVLLPYPSADPRQLGGMFAPTAAFHQVGPTFQTRERMLPGAPIFQRPDGDLQKLHRARPIPASIEEEAHGIARDQELVVRAPDGRTVPTDVVWVRELPLPPVDPAGPRGELRDACDSLGVDYTGWMLMFRVQVGAGDAA